jgi:PadR family transcriptional regulator PadR
MKAMYLCIVKYYKIENMSINTENIKSQMRKGILEYCILLIMENKSAYAPDIIKILQKAQLIIVEGTLYPLLMRLKNSGLLSYQWVESTQGPPRKYYTLTEEGKLILSELETAWLDMNKTIKLLKNKQLN